MVFRRLLRVWGFFIVALLFFNSTFLRFSFAQTITPTETPTPTQTPDNSQVAQDLLNKIAELQSKITDLQGQEKTLASQIDVMDSQIKITEYRITATQQQILSLEEDIDTAQKKISSLENSLSDLTKILLNRIVTAYKLGLQDQLQELVASSSISDFFAKESYLKIVERHDKQLVYDTVQAKNDYANQKQIFEDKKKKIEALKTQLEAYTDQLNGEKNAKQQLLSDTQGSEANYQQQLATYKAQLASLANFAISRAGGANILPHQDLSDGWGRYYNQRDANWGNNLIGYSGEAVWEVGCLLTSYAMVSSHFGATVTPADVASNGDDFALGTAYFRVPGPAPAGHSASYVTNPTKSDLVSAIQGGAVVIAGMSDNGGPYPQHYSDHWVVLRGVDGSGNFIINDPWYQGAMDVSIDDHYSGWTIIEARIYK